MLKRFMKKGRGEEKKLLALELSEIEEIAEKLFARLERNVKAVESAEKRLDDKIGAIEKLLIRAERLNPGGDSCQDTRSREVISLSEKGLKVDEIAGILDMPRGEVELILSLHK